MGIKRYATAHWEGDLKSGRGGDEHAAERAVPEQRYSFNTRFGEGEGHQPESCWPPRMPAASAWRLGLHAREGRLQEATRIDTPPKVQMETARPVPSATGVKPGVTASVPGLDAGKFAEIAEKREEESA
jgi:osmotically inducible protein OsmC